MFEAVGKKKVTIIASFLSIEFNKKTNPISSDGDLTYQAHYLKSGNVNTFILHSIYLYFNKFSSVALNSCRALMR